MEKLLGRRHTPRCLGWERMIQRLFIEEMHNTNTGSYHDTTFGRVRLGLKSESDVFGRAFFAEYDMPLQ